MQYLERGRKVSVWRGVCGWSPLRAGRRCASSHSERDTLQRPTHYNTETPDERQLLHRPHTLCSQHSTPRNRTLLLEDTPVVLSLGKLCDEHGYSYEWINGQKPHLIKNGIRIQCNTENFVPIVIPGLSASSSSSLPTSTPMTPLRQAIDHSKSSSSSSTSTSTTPSGQDTDHSDHHPAIESSESVGRQARGDPFTSETSEELLTKPTKIPKPIKNEDHERVRGDPYSDRPNGCKNSERILWMTEFLNTETHTRVLLMNHL